MTRHAAFLVAIAVLLGSAAAYHTVAGNTVGLEAAVGRVAEVPLVIGDWQGVESPKDDTDTRSFEQAGAKSYWIRTYVHQRTQTSVAVILMCGRAGKMSVHTPEICYRGAGFDLADQPKVIDFTNQPDEVGSRFWTGQFLKKSAPPTSLRLYWAWNSRGVWQASTSPRWQFRGEPFLYKLYVSRDACNLQSIDPSLDPTADFLRELLPVLERSLF